MISHVNLKATVILGIVDNRVGVGGTLELVR